jgi:hypothetical protein
MTEKFNEQAEPYWDFPEHDLRLKIYDIILSQVETEEYSYINGDEGVRICENSIRIATDIIIEHLKTLEIYKDKNIEWQ